MYKTASERFTAASSSAAAPIVSAHSTSVNTPEGIERFRMITCLSGLRLESAGIRMSRGISCLAIARRDYGIAARDASVAYARLRTKMLDLGIIIEAEAR